MDNPGHISECSDHHFYGLKYLNSLMRIRDGKKSDPGWKNSVQGPGINIPDPQHCLNGTGTFGIHAAAIGDDPHPLPLDLGEVRPNRLHKVGGVAQLRILRPAKTALRASSQKRLKKEETSGARSRQIMNFCHLVPSHAFCFFVSSHDLILM
jgi:hypothetical protein